MTRSALAIVFLQVSVLLVLTLSATTDGLPLEDRLEQLTRDFVRKLTNFSVYINSSVNYVKDM